MPTRALRIVVLSCLFLSLPARATEFGVLGLLNLSGSSSTSRVTVPPTPAWDGKTTFGVGGFVRSSSSPLLNLELDVIYLSRTLTAGTLGDVSFPTIEAPVLLRFSFIPLLSLGAGGYYAIRVGDPTSSTGGNPGTYNRHDFGLVAAAGLDLPLGPVGLLLEARYLFGIADMDPDLVGTLHWRNWQIVAGLHF